MPSPIGHAIAGAAIAWAITPSKLRPQCQTRDSDTGLRHRMLPLVCAALAAAPDLDLLTAHAHRTFTHSLTAVALVTIITIGVTRKVPSTRFARSGRAPSTRFARSGRAPSTRFARSGQALVTQPRLIVLACVLAYASHLLLDWLAVDQTVPRGVQLFWPFGDGWFISGLDLFRGTARRPMFSGPSLRINLLAVAQEVAILGPIAWLIYRRTQTSKGERRVPQSRSV